MHILSAGEAVNKSRPVVMASRSGERDYACDSSACLLMGSGCVCLVQIEYFCGMSGGPLATSVSHCCYIEYLKPFIWSGLWEQTKNCKISTL